MDTPTAKTGIELKSTTVSPDAAEIDRLTESMERWAPLLMLLVIAVLSLFILFHTVPALADARLPGDDVSAKMESAGTLLRFIDTGLFKWVARVLAGLCIFGAGWSLKEMRFGPAVISMIAAILFGTAPTWVKNIFSIGGADSVFSMTAPSSAPPTLASVTLQEPSDA